MAGDVNPIYQRLNGIQNYHPFTANTFADWSLEAGDIVSINRGGSTYSGPTQINTVKWNGQQQVTVEVPGEQTRGPVSRMSAETYNGGNGGGNGYRSGYRRNTKEELIGARIRENADNIELEAWNREQADNTFEASLKVQADRITAEVKNRKAGDETLSGKIEIEAGKITQMVEAVGKDGKVTAASIVAAINGSRSEVVISADHIKLNGNVTLGSVMSVQGRTTSIHNILSVDGSYIDCNALTIHNENVRIDGSCNKMVKYANHDKTTNTLYMTLMDGEKIAFKKATALSGRWSGTPQGTVADFEYYADDTSIPIGSTYIALSASGSTVYARDPSGIARASISAGTSYSHSAVLTYDHFDDDEELYYYRSEDLITRKSVGAAKTVHYN